MGYLTDGSQSLPALMAVNVSESQDTYGYVYNGLNDVTA